MTKFRVIPQPFGPDHIRPPFVVDAEYFKVEGSVYAFYANLCLIAAVAVNSVLSVTKETA